MALKICHECGKDVSDEADKCQNCGAPVRKNILKQKLGCTGCLGVIILLLMFTGIISRITDTTKKTPEPEARPVEEKVTPSLPPHDLPDLHIQAFDLINSYNNPKSGSEQYEGRTIVITGTISGIFIPPSFVVTKMAEKGLSAQPFIYFSDKPVSDVRETLMGDGVSCYFLDESLVAKASQMDRGQSITLRCKCRGRYTLEDCTLANETPPNLNETPADKKVPIVLHYDKDNQAYSLTGLCSSECNKDCQAAKGAGTIVDIKYDHSTTGRAAFSLLTIVDDEGKRNYLNISYPKRLYEDLGTAEFEQLERIIKNGNRVEVKSYLCGVGGRITMLDEISLIR